jgi:hypothetical protein
MLKNTLILPESDAKLAASLLWEAIESLDVVLMLVIGKDGDQEQVVRWADALCQKTRVNESINLRHVVWVRKPDVKPVRQILDPILGEGQRPIVAVLNFHDELRTTIGKTAKIRPLLLENAFAKGHA